jgi:hypothetical protein
MPRGTAADRVRDAIVLAVLVGGGALFFYARRNLQLLAAGLIARVPGQSAVERTEHFDRLSRLGLWTVGAGLLLAAVVTAYHHRSALSPHREP